MQCRRLAAAKLPESGRDRAAADEALSLARDLLPRRERGLLSAERGRRAALPLRVR